MESSEERRSDSVIPLPTDSDLEPSGGFAYGLEGFPREFPIRALHTYLSEVGREMPSAAGQPDRATGSEAGCRTDHDCKGERICQGGLCVFPSRSMTGGDGPDEPPPLRKAPREPAPKGHFSEQGVVELGGGVGLGFQETRLKQEGYEDFKSSTTTFRIDAYIGYFVARRFVLGVLVVVPVSRSRMDGYSSTNSWELALVLAPGFAVPIGERVFIYGDALLGFSVSTQESGGDETKITAGYFGAELGLKLVLGKNYLLRIGFRPAYLVGDVGGSDMTASDLRIGLSLGFSGFL